MKSDPTTHSVIANLWELFLFIASFKAMLVLAIAFSASLALLLATFLSRGLVTRVWTLDEHFSHSPSCKNDTEKAAEKTFNLKRDRSQLPESQRLVHW